MRILVLSLLLIQSLLANCQIAFEDVEKVIALGRDSVINLAISHLEESGFSNIDPSQFDLLTVRTDGYDVEVTFDKSIQYVPVDTYVIHAAVVRLIQTSVGWLPSGDHEPTFESNQFYEYTPDDEKAIDFVLSHHQKLKGNTLTIFENKGHYLISEKSEGGESGYKLDKLSGEQSDDWYGNFDSEDFFDDGFKKVDW